MDQADFPDFIRNLPQADIPFEGITGFLLQSEMGQVVLLETETESHVSPHSHGNQWGIVVNGKMDLRIGENWKTYRPGDSYFIPKGTVHEARLYPGFKVVDFFQETGRYKVKN